MQLKKLTHATCATRLHSNICCRSNGAHSCFRSFGMTVKPENNVYMGGVLNYDGLDISEFRHCRINHSEEFVEAGNHINGIDNFHTRKIFFCASSMAARKNTSFGLNLKLCSLIQAGSWRNMQLKRVCCAICFSLCCRHAHQIKLDIIQPNLPI